MHRICVGLAIFYMAHFTFGNVSQLKGVVQKTFSSALDVIEELDKEYTFGGDGASKMSDGEYNNNQHQGSQNIRSSKRHNDDFVDSNNSEKYDYAPNFIRNKGKKRESDFVDFEESKRIICPSGMIGRCGRKRQSDFFDFNSSTEFQDSKLFASSPSFIGRNGRKRDAPGFIGRNGRKRDAPGFNVF